MKSQWSEDLEETFKSKNTCVAEAGQRRLWQVFVRPVHKSLHSGVIYHSDKKDITII